MADSMCRWDKLLHLCRFLDDSVVWACFAAMAVKANHLDKAEVAFAAIEHVRHHSVTGYVLSD